MTSLLRYALLILALLAAGCVGPATSSGGHPGTESGPNQRPAAPKRLTTAILGDLNTKRARIENQDSLPGDLAVISGKVPLAEVTRYAAQLGSITQGQGAYTMEYSHYDLVPGNVQQQIVSKAKLAEEEED